MAVDNDDLLAHGDHPAIASSWLTAKAECLALPESCARPEQHKQRVAARHGGGERENLSRGEQRMTVRLISGRRLSSHGVLRI